MTRFARGSRLASSLRMAFRRAQAGATGPGVWIFRQPNLAWLHAVSENHTLPLHLRVFERYCGAQQRLGVSGRVVGGRSVFRALARLGAILGVDPQLRLDLGEHVIHLNTRDPRALHVPNELSRDSEPALLLARWVRQGDTFLDIGANHGSFSVLASKLVGSEGLIVAVEPQAELARLVERSLQEVKGLRFIVKALALGDGSGNASFYVPCDSSGAAGLFPGFSARTAHGVRTVELASLDDALAWQSFPGRTFMKLDVEGSELAVLRGARRFIRACKPTVFLETNDATLRAANVALEDLRDEFVEAGYTRVSPFPGIGWLPIDRLPSIRAANVLVTTEERARENGTA